MPANPCRNPPSAVRHETSGGAGTVHAAATGTAMTDAQARYAIYFVPAANCDLYRFGSAMLGYDCYSGEDVPTPADAGIDAESWRRLTEEPRRYGFHATLKAPFRLAPGCSEAELVQAFFAFAQRERTPTRIDPDIRLLGTFTAIVPCEPSAPLAALAERCTTELDPFRAAMPAAERERRAAGLSARQVHHLDRWGYPYVFEDFRFHMTLTGRLPPAQQDAVLALLRRHFARSCGDHPIAIDRLGLFKQEHADARFRVLHHAEIGGAA
jgi:putative phosphonate metabolism protein